ncbi:MAG: SDR family NAD(P)-dependent oxidoreductase [Neisseria sp.]|uniref:SDR family NAD(P)-dependent oxidoreductase n=1 Tax=Neisseria sp. TaxID=192066 RepID=UPI0026DBE93E|nr:SDR family NAD(P)-dependent oxidoreductase [Neisseria sp.]MDO4641132.1 SDR family NAD(P)-dependent oxidoreductase [Neisseria sp.]
MQDVAILGFGYLGRPLAEKLYLKGCRISALKRNLSSDDVNLPVDLQCADLNDIGHYGAIFGSNWSDKPAWVCLLPPTPLPNYDACLKEWCRLAEDYGVQHLIFTSSISVYGDRPRRCDENSLPEPQTENARKILAAEHIFLSSKIPNIDILRLGGLYSADRHPLHRMLARQVPIKKPNHPVNMLHRDSAVAVLSSALTNVGGLRIRNIVEQAHPTKREFYRAQAQVLGLPLPSFETDDETNGKTVYSLFNDLWL